MLKDDAEFYRFPASDWLKFPPIPLVVFKKMS